MGVLRQIDRKSFFLTLFVVFFGCVLFWGQSFSEAFSTVTLGDVKITYSGPPEFADKIKALVPLKPGQKVSQEQIETVVGRLANSGVFGRIRYELLGMEKGLSCLSIDVAKPPKVRDLSVRGNYPILNKHITKLIVLQPGADFDPSLLPEASEAVKRFLEKEGYYDSQVSLAEQKTDNPGLVDLKIRITKGQTFRIGNISFKGNNIFDAGRLNRRFRHLAHFRQTRLKNDLKALQQLYRRHGYIKARAKLTDLVFHPDTGKVDLAITIRENKRFEVVIAGNPFFDLARVKAATKFGEMRSYDRYAVRTATERLKKYYARRGFVDAVIDAQITKPDKHTVVVTFTITPGKRVTLSKIRFEGNKDVGEKRLKKAMKSSESGFLTPKYFDQRTLLEDQMRLEAFYHENGFFEAVVEAPKTQQNSFGDQRVVTYDVSEGQTYRLGRLTIVSDESLNLELLRKRADLKEGKKFRAKDLDNGKAKLIEEVFKLGYAYADVSLSTEPHHDNKTVDVAIAIKRGPLVRVRNLVVDGNQTTQEKVITKNLKIKTGDVFVYKHVLNAQLNLRRLGVFSSVRIVPLGFDEKASEIDLLVSVGERKSVALGLHGGFDSRHWVTGEFSLTKYNLFGLAKQFNTRFIGGARYDRVEMTFFSPRVFGASWNLANQYFGQFEDETYYDAVSYGAFVNTLKNFGPRWTFGFKEQVSRTDVLQSRSDTLALGDALFDNTFNEFQTSLLFDTRDNFSDPQKGVYILAQNELNTDLTNISNNFDTYQLALNHYLGFFKRLTLVNTFRFSHTFGLTGGTRVPVNKLFFMGGADTLRGFTEDGVDPSGGTVRLMFNTELQLKLTQSIKVAGFFDTGALEDDLQAIDEDSFRESAGMGLRYFTPIGPLRLDWGFILDRQTGEPESRVHFSFGYFF